MAAWMKPSELRPGAGVQLKDTSGNFGAALSRDGEGRYVFYVQAGDGSYRGPTSKTLAQDGEWAHVTAVFEEGCMGLHINATLENKVCDHKGFQTAAREEGCMGLYINATLENKVCDHKGFQTAAREEGAPELIVGHYSTPLHSNYFKGSMA